MLKIRWMGGKVATSANADTFRLAAQAWRARSYWVWMCPGPVHLQIALIDLQITLRLTIAKRSALGGLHHEYGLVKEAA